MGLIDAVWMELCFRFVPVFPWVGCDPLVFARSSVRSLRRGFVGLSGNYREDLDGASMAGAR